MKINKNKPTMQPGSSVAFYIRTSVEEGNSIKSQIEKLHDFVDKHELLISNIFIDTERNGEMLDGIGLLRLVMSAVTTKFSAVIMTDKSRLSRNTIHFNILEATFNRSGVELIFLSEYDLLD